MLRWVGGSINFTVVDVHGENVDVDLGGQKGNLCPHYY